MTIIKDIQKVLYEAKHRIKLEEEKVVNIKELERQKLGKIRENRQLLILNRNKEDELTKRENKLRDLEHQLLKMDTSFNSTYDDNQKEEEKVKLLEKEQYHLLIRQQKLQKIVKLWDQAFG